MGTYTLAPSGATYGRTGVVLVATDAGASAASAPVPPMDHCPSTFPDHDVPYRLRPSGDTTPPAALEKATLAGAIAVSTPPAPTVN